MERHIIQQIDGALSAVASDQLTPAGRASDDMAIPLDVVSLSLLQYSERLRNARTP